MEAAMFIARELWPTIAAFAVGAALGKLFAWLYPSRRRGLTADQRAARDLVRENAKRAL